MFGVSLPRSIYPMVPGYATMRLRKKSGAANPDTFAAPINVQGREKTGSVEERIYALLQTTDPLFQITLFDMGEATFVAPAAEDEIITPDGTRYRVRHVEEKVLKTLYPCVCSLKRSQS